MDEKSIKICLILMIAAVSSILLYGCGKQPVSTAEDFDLAQQGFFGTVSYHVYGCGVQPPDGSGCDMKGTDELAGEGVNITVNVADKIDSYGNINSKHPVANVYTDKKGSYKVSVRPGNYMICVEDRDCGNNDNLITITAGKFTEVNLSIDMPRP